VFGLGKEGLQDIWVLLGQLIQQSDPVFLVHGARNQFQDIRCKKFTSAVRGQDSDLIGFVLRNS